MISLAFSIENSIAQSIQTKEGTVGDKEVKEVVKYYMGFYTREPVREFESDETESIQDQHLSYIASLVERKKVLIAGPFEDKEEHEIRGILIFKVDSIEVARELMASDPAVLAGRLNYFIRPWLGERGACLK